MANASKKVTIVGSIALDSVETPFGRKEDILGGSASYAALSASFFAPVNLISVVGKDFPKRYLNLYKKNNIDITGVEVKPGKTFRWKAHYNYNLNSAETLDTQLGVFQSFLKPEIPKNVSRADNLLLANIDPVLQEWVLDKVKPTGIVAMDTMNHWIANRKKELMKLLKKVDLFLVNEGEARQISGEENLLNAASAIQAKGPKMLVIKKGEHGALFFHEGLLLMVPAYLLEKLHDPTGAGDTFAGAMIGYLSQFSKVTERELRKSLVYASILASFTVEKFSVKRLTEITREDIEYRYNQFEKLTEF